MNTVTVPARNESKTRDIQKRWYLAPDFFVGLALFLVALGFYLYALGDPSLWYDESYSVELTRQPFSQMWQIIWGPEPNMALYYFLLYGWLRLAAIFGIPATEFITRLPSAIMMALSVPVFFWLGKRFFGLLAGSLATLLFLSSHWVLIYAQQARTYGLQMLLLCISWFCLLHLCSNLQPTKRYWIGYILTTALLFYAHIFSALILITQIITVASFAILPGQWQGIVRKQKWLFVGALLAIGLLIIPIGSVAMHGARATGWLPVPRIRDIFNLLMFFAMDSRWYLLTMMAVCAIGIALMGLAMAATRFTALQKLKREKSWLGLDLQGQKYGSTLWALLCWLILPIGLVYLISQGSLHVFSTRYLGIVVPALFLLVGLGFAALGNRTLQVIFACLLLFFAFQAVPDYYRGAQIEDWRTPTTWIQQHYQDGDGLVCADPFYGECQTPVEYYLHTLPNCKARFDADAPNSFSWQRFGLNKPDQKTDGVFFTGYGKKHKRVFYIIGRVHNDQAAGDVKLAQQWLDSHYRFVDQVVNSSVTVRLYEVG